MEDAQKKNYIAYSLWGDKAIYNTGMLRNIAQANTIYPGWQVVVYYDNTVPSQSLEQIRAAGAHPIDMTGGIYGMFWRFLATDLPHCNRVIFRDSDSRLSERERLAVNEWIANDHAIHIMRDHPYHLDPVDHSPHYILGGMWGIKGGLVNMTTLIDHYAAKKELSYGSDQVFLNQIYDLFRDSATIHDEFFSGLPFPQKRKGYRFVGERIDTDEKPAGDDWKAVRAFYADKKPLNILIRKIKKLIRGLFRQLNPTNVFS
ncbi:hypothetical protein SNE26_20165 [Mucilaginibacter sp. cycad4]|uniref:hypothetical protein n=1 Tax=Mucilaginibacter sp. cycad4 TaxID=3342096 RepID=UPI002AAC31BF|nr:hypothetical protein [Mucilaginibacter gossypii]WPU98343.1 hypothetical protein SNE26_20165 [Mucilaginibacter gossypii]